ncbi:MAG: sialidase family protein, partial [candidate division WOR-3 bacterium]|nr:sialidase family protein [candidate division WOR-3 bacterium]
QKSTDAGSTWLPSDVLVQSSVRYSECYRPDITTDWYGDIYVVYHEHNDSSEVHLICCVRSTDGGATWSPPAQVKDSIYGDVGWARIAADSVGNLFCAWNDSRTEWSRIWSSVSTDRGMTWSRNVRVDDMSDTLWNDCYQADVFVQPRTDHYLVAAQVPFDGGGRTYLGCYLYCSSDMGQSFQPGVRFDTSYSYAGLPHVVADAQHIVCDYTEPSCNLVARTLYAQPDTWGAPRVLGPSWQAGGLAISADGRVHAVRQARPPGGGPYYAYYALSSDHGASWSDPEPANDDTHAEAYDPDISVDSAGHAYIVWRNLESGALWFATNNLAAIAEQPPQQRGTRPIATVIQRVLVLNELGTRSELPEHNSVMSRAALLDIGGRKVLDLKPGANDVRALAPGVYFVREEPQAANSKPQPVRKVVVTR